MSTKRHPKTTTIDARRRRKMLWFLGIWAVIALAVATLRAVMIRMDPNHKPVHPRQALPPSPQP